MDPERLEYLKFQYEEGARIIRYWIECRYKILQFVGYFNAGVLTFGFSQGILLSKEDVFPGAAICALSAVVASMGLATEYSATSYNEGYFAALRIIEDLLKKDGFVGIMTHSKTSMHSKFQKVLPVRRAHKLFYVSLFLFWCLLFYWQTRL
jgi:hypothetical protein